MPLNGITGRAVAPGQPVTPTNLKPILMNIVFNYVSYIFLITPHVADTGKGPRFWQGESPDQRVEMVDRILSVANQYTIPE